MYRNFEEISKKAKERGPCKVSILFPGDPDIMRVAVDGIREGLIGPVLVGHSNRIKQIAQEANLPLNRIELREEVDPQDAANLCLDMAKKGEVSFSAVD